MLHELGHTLGLYHEQNRPDRDQFVEILYNNIKYFSLRKNFDKLPESEVNSLNITYDYQSIMHYSKTVSTFSILRIFL